MKLAKILITSFLLLSSCGRLPVGADEPSENMNISSLQSPSSCCPDCPSLYRDDLPCDGDFLLPPRIEVTPLGNFSFSSFESDRFLLSEDHGRYVLTARSIAVEAQGASSTKLSFRVDGETADWRLFTFRNAFGQETFSRVCTADAASLNNLFMLRAGLITREVYDLNASDLSHGDLNVAYDLSAVRADYYATVDGLPPAGEPARPTGYQYSGTVRLQDYRGDWHGLGYFRFYLFARNVSTGLYEMVSYCDLSNSGAFSLTCPATGYDDTRFRIYSSFSCCTFVDENDDSYFIDIIHASIPPLSFSGEYLNIYLTQSINPILWAVSAARCSYLYARYLTNNSFSEPVTMKYLTDSKDSSCYYVYNHETIHETIFLATNELLLEQGHLNKGQNWDLVSHEYGHHVSNVIYHQSNDSIDTERRENERQCPQYAPHYLNFSDCDSEYMYLFAQCVTYSSEPATISDLLASARYNGLWLAWSEAWPTFFGNCMQNYFSSYLNNYPTCCDGRYSFSENSSYCYMESSHAETDSCEGAIISFLLDLNDSSNGSYDTLTISDKTIFNLNLAYSCFSFNEFYLALLDYGVDANQLGLLLAHCGMCPGKDDVSINSLGYSRYTSDGSGSSSQWLDFHVTIDCDYLDRHVHYDYDHCEYSFYAYANNVYTLVLEKQGPSSWIDLDISELRELAINNTLYMTIKVVYSSSDPNDYYISPLIQINTQSIRVV